MRNNEHDANEALAEAIARQERHIAAANAAGTVEEFREHIRAATDAYSAARKLRTERFARRFD